MPFRFYLMFCAGWICFLTHCGENPTLPTSGCDPKTAVILVSEGHVSNLCGCQETGQTAAAGTALSCTISKDTKVFFMFQGKRKKQVMITRSSFSTDSFIYQKSKKNFRMFLFIPPSNGSFSYYDRFLPSLKGTLVVQ